MDGERQRVDRFLWHARLVRTRTLAAKLTAAGHVRVNGKRIDAPGRGLKIGDVLTVAISRDVRVLKVLAFAERRGGSEAAGRLYEDLSPPSPKPVRSVSPAPRLAGSGRPTKRERRALDRLQRGFDA
ncbi:MAG TPA: RNA-binding S4 domain-containing protein [Xanthobacteraceae bacterium]